MSIILSTESTADLTVELAQYLGIEDVVHFYVEKEGVSYRDDTFSLEELFSYTDKTGIMCRTSAPNAGDFEKHFSNLLAKNPDAQILHFSISSGMSSSAQNANIGADGNPNIKVVDSHGTSGTMVLMMMYAKELIDAGYDFDEVYNKVMERRDFILTSMIVNDLKYLAKGGRCSKVAALGANILKIRPVIGCDKENGAFQMGKKMRGPSLKCVLDYIDDKVASSSNIDKKWAFFSYSTVDDATVAKAVERIKSHGFEHVYFHPSCATNSYHAGPGVVGVQFFDDGPHEVKKKGE